MARKINAREKRFLIAAAAAALVFIFGKWILLPLFHYASGASDIVEEQLEVIEAYRSVVARGPLLEEEAEELDEALRAYDSLLLPGTTPPLAAADLESRIKTLAANAGLTVQSGKVLKHLPREFFLEVPVQIVATGTIENVRGFIVAVESSPTFIDIAEMQLRALPRRQPARGARSSPSAELLQATMTITGLMPAVETGEGGTS